MGRITIFKAMLLFIKTHAIATAVATTVVVGSVTTAIVVPPIVEEYQLTKTVETNLDMLVSSDYEEPSEIENEETTIENTEENNEVMEEAKQEEKGKEPLTFTVKRIEKNDNGNKDVTWKIVPSYDKDFSQWSKEEKQAYNEALQEANKKSLEEFENDVKSEEQKLEEIMKELQTNEQ